MRAVVPWQRRDTAALLLLALLAFLIRLMLVLLTSCIGTDSDAYLMSAVEMQDGTWYYALDHGIHPGYPAAILTVGTVVGNFEYGGYLVSILFSSLAMIPFYLLLRDISDRRTAILSVLFFACLSAFVREHADILTEGFFQFWFVSSVCAAWFGATRKSLLLYVLSGACGAAAYLTRPEGIYTPIALLGITVLNLVASARAKEPMPLRTLAFALAGLVVFFAGAYPLISWYKTNTGSWLVKRNSVKAAERTIESTPAKTVETQKRPEHSSGALWILKELSKRIPRMTHWVLIPLILGGLYFCRRKLKGLGVLYLLCLSLGYLFPNLVAAWSGYPISKRYLLVPLLFLLPFGALGGIQLAQFAFRRWKGKAVRIVVACAFGLLFTGTLIKGVRPRRPQEIGIRSGAIWLRTKLQSDSMVYSSTRKADYYVGLRTQDEPRTAESAETFSLKEGEFLFVVEPREHRKQRPERIKVLDRRFRRIATFPKEPDDRVDRVYIYAP